MSSALHWVSSLLLARAHGLLLAHAPPHPLLFLRFLFIQVGPLMSAIFKFVSSTCQRFGDEGTGGSEPLPKSGEEIDVVITSMSYCPHAIETAIRNGHLRAPPTNVARTRAETSDSDYGARRKRLEETIAQRHPSGKLAKRLQLVRLILFLACPPLFSLKRDSWEQIFFVGTDFLRGKDFLRGFQHSYCFLLT